MKFAEQLKEYQRLPPLFRGKTLADYAEKHSVKMDYMQQLDEMAQKYELDSYDNWMDGLEKGFEQGAMDAAPKHYKLGHKEGYIKASKNILTEGAHVIFDKNNLEETLQAPTKQGLTKMMKKDTELYKPFIYSTDTHNKDPFWNNSAVIISNDLMYVDLEKVRSLKTPTELPIGSPKKGPGRPPKDQAVSPTKKAPDEIVGKILTFDESLNKYMSNITYIPFREMIDDFFGANKIATVKFPPPNTKYTTPPTSPTKLLTTKSPLVSPATFPVAPPTITTTTTTTTKPRRNPARAVKKGTPKKGTK